MALNNVLLDSFHRSFDLYRDFVASLNQPTLGQQLPDLPSNTIGQQLWCVVGARESYSDAILAGAWNGFSCSLGANDIHVKTAVIRALQGSEKSVINALKGVDAFSPTQIQLMVDLLEHEIQHHGQLIRYIYGLRLQAPASWQKRYALD